MTNENGLTYASAGVDVAAGNALVDRIKPLAKRTNRAGAMGNVGGFGALFDPKGAGFIDPVLVAATDGVGTKLRIAIETGQFDGIGRDLVAMCVNDLLCLGAEPLFFLDYLATGKLELDQAEAVIASIAEGCTAAGAALIGGETAEMPGFYSKGDFDLAGFAVGALERGSQLPLSISEGDILIGLASSGAHANGFSLIRKVTERAGLTWDSAAPFGSATLGQELLTPTRIYVKTVLPLLKNGSLRALAHITGGGLTENIPRVLPEGFGAEIALSSWTRPALFDWLAEAGNISADEMLLSFNCGIGMVLVVRPGDVEATLTTLANSGEDAWQIGRVIAGNGVVYSHA